MAGLKASTSLMWLNLKNNSIGPTGCVALCQGLAASLRHVFSFSFS
jgi:hypothetical protein